MTRDFRKERRALLTMSEEDRFWFKVQKGEGCWEWLGSRSTDGYGLLARGKTGDGEQLASRRSWELTHGPIPEGLLVCHHCDNPPCVRPDHLYLGTQSDNMRDARSKGRMPVGQIRRYKRKGRRHGEGVWGCKLTEAKVVEMRRVHALGGRTCQSLADEYRVNIGTVSRVISRRLWRHVA